MARSSDLPNDADAATVAGGAGARRVINRLPRSFDMGMDESQWLLTLLSADDLRYIFEGTPYDETPP